MTGKPYRALIRDSSRYVNFYNFVIENAYVQKNPFIDFRFVHHPSDDGFRYRKPIPVQGSRH